MGAFDDLIPGNESSAPSGGVFDDLIPKKKEVGIADRLKQGLASTANYARINMTDDPQKIAGLVADTEAGRPAQTPAQAKMTEEIQPYAKEASDATGVVNNVAAYGKLAGKRIGQFASNPKEFAGMMAENLPNSVPGIAAGLVGAKIGGLAGSVAGPVGGVVGSIAGGLAGGTAGGYQVEQGSSMHDQIVKEAQARGINPTDKEALAGLIQEKYPEFLKASQLKGVGTAGTDAALNVATLGIAGTAERQIAREARSLSELAKAGKISAADAVAAQAGIDAKIAAHNTLGQKALRGAGVAGGEMAGESISEGVGQQMAYGKLDPLDVVDEGLLGFGQGVATAGARKIVSPIMGTTEKGGIESAANESRAAVSKLEETGPLSSAVNAGIDSGATSLNAAEQYRQRADAIPAGSFGQMNEFADLVNSEREDLANRREAVRDTIPYERVDTPSPLSLAAEAQRTDGIPFEGTKPQAPDLSIQGSGSFADQAELANLIAAEKADVGQRRAAVTNNTQANRAERSQQAIASDMAQDELAPVQASPIERLMATRTDTQLTNLSNQGHRQEVRQAAMAELQRRMSTPSQPTTTAPQQQQATEFNLPESINAAQAEPLAQKAPQANDAQVRAESPAAQEAEGVANEGSQSNLLRSKDAGPLGVQGESQDQQKSSAQSEAVPVVAGESNLASTKPKQSSPNQDNTPVTVVNESRGVLPISNRENAIASKNAADDSEEQAQSSGGERNQDGATEAGTRATEDASVTPQESTPDDIISRAKALGMKTVGVSADKLEKQVAEAESFNLSKQTNEQASAEFKRQQEEANKKDEEPASPTVKADQVDLFNTQDALFSNNREAKPATVEAEKATEPSKPKNDATKEPAQDKAPAVTAESEQNKPEAITDFGEKLEGAKKDLWKTYQKAMSDDLPANAKDITLSKHFPEPDYENLIASGLDIRAVAAIKAMRDAIPAKPRMSYKVTRWADNLKTLRSFANDIITGKQNIDHILSEMRKVRGLSDLVDAVSLYAELGYPAFKNAGGYKVSGGWNKLDENMKAVKEDVYGLTDGRGRVTMYDTRTEAIDALRAKLQVEPENTGRTVKLDLYKVTSTGDIVIGKKIASNKFIDLKTGFKTAREAREYLNGNESELLELLEQKKRVQPTRRGVNEPRVGKDYRLGEDVTPEKFAGEFGFRGVQFGNYVEQGRRTKDMNNAYDALLDLANTLGIPPRAVSLNGSLGLAFGARGNGGVDPAAAHFEPDQVVINLTKMNGAGSLGHEWLHALDNYFSRAREKNDGFLSAMPYERGNGVRPEVVKAFSDLMKEIKDSGFAKRSSQLDQRRSKDYWGTPEELAARAFEGYLISKAEENGESNDYLANIVSEEAHKIFNEMNAEFGGQNEEPYPYPTREEMKLINPKFDALFKMLKTKETDKGIALYSKGNAQGQVITQQEAEQRINAMFGDKIGQALIDSGIVSFTNKGNAYQGATFKDGTIALNLDALTADNFDGVLAHEGFHSSIKELVGEATYTKLMKQLDMLVKAGKGSQWAKDALAAVPKNTEAENVTEEIGAYAVEMHINGGKIPGALKRWAQSFLSALRTAIIKRITDGKLKMWAISNITAQDLSKLAIAGLKAKAAGQMQAQGREAMEYSQNGDKEIPYAIVSGNEIDGAIGTTIQQKAISWMRTNLQGKSFKNDHKGWDISVSRKGINKSMMHAAKEVHSRSVAAIPSLLKNSVLVHSEENNNPEERESVPLVHHFYAPLRVGNRDYIARMVVKEAKDGHRFYDYDTSDEISPAVIGATLPFSQRMGAAPGARLTMSMDKLLSHVKKEHGGTDPMFSKTNQTATTEFKKWFGDSKVVDADGNPLVVYHGTKNDFTTFHPNSHFGTKEQADSMLAEKRGKIGKRVIPVYLSIQKMKRVNDQEIAQRWSDVVASAKRQGYDGLIYKNEFEGDGTQDSYIVFNPEQIKSAIGNNGGFDASNPDIRYSKAAQIIGDSGPFAIPRESKMDDLIYAMQDKQVDLKRVVENIKKADGTLNDNIDPYLQEELFHGRSAKGVSDFLDFELKPLINEMRMRGVGMADFEEYLWNRHAEERNKQIAKINAEMPDGGSGIKTADAKAYLDALPAGKKEAYDSLAKRIDAINKKSQDILVSSGLEKQSTIDAWNGDYQHYVPLHREDVETGHMGTGKGYSIRGNASKRATGSNKSVVDILANITQQRERNVVRAEKVRMSNALYGLAKANPNPELWTVDEAPTERVVVNRGGKDEVVTRIIPGFAQRDNVIHTRIDGEDHYVILNEREPRAVRMAQAIKNLDADQLGRVLSATAKATRYLASINTQFNPVFGIVNLTRDAQGAMLNLSTTELKGQQKKVLGYTVSALRGIYADVRAHRRGEKPNSEWANLHEEFKLAGGQTGFRDQYENAAQRGEAIQKELSSIDRNFIFKRAGAVFDWLSDYNDTMENSVRLAAYRAAKEQGMSIERAASLAKNLTVNFNRKGQVSTQMGALYAFFNASVQGTARLAETMTGPAGKRIFYGGLLLGSMQAMLLAAAGMGDDEPPEFVRERSIILPIGDGKYVSVPMPLGFHIIPNLARIPTEFVMSGFKNPANRIADLVGLFADTFNPIGNAGLSLQTIAPTVVDPLAALSENRDWTGKPIAKLDRDSMNPTPGYLRAKDTATTWSKGISYGLNLLTGGTDYKKGLFSPTPDQIDYLIGQATGGVGREATKLEQTVMSAVTGEDMPLYKVPLVGRFVGDTQGQSAEGGKFYAAMTRINEHENEIKGMRTHNRSNEIAGYIAENPESKLVASANHVERSIQKLKQTKRKAIENGDTERVKQAEMLITQQMRNFNKQVEALSK